MKKNLLNYILAFLFALTAGLLFYLMNQLPQASYDALQEKFIPVILIGMVSIGLMGLLYAPIMAILSKNEEEVLEIEKQASEEFNSSDTAASDRNIERIEAFKAHMQNGLKAVDGKSNNYEKGFKAFCQYFEISQAICYLKDPKDQKLKLAHTFALLTDEHTPMEVIPGEGLTGQVVMDKKPLLIQRLPENYNKIISGLGQSQPFSLLILPVGQDQVEGIYELSSLKPIDEQQSKYIAEACAYLNTTLN